jgi:hypothetical protein
MRALPSLRAALRRAYLWMAARTDRAYFCHECGGLLNQSNRMNFPFDTICLACYFKSPARR